MVKSSLVRGLLIVVVIGALGAGAWYYYRDSANKGPDYFTAAAQEGTIVQSVTATGTIQPVLDVLVSSQISGYINSLAADFNSQVRKGDLLCTLLPDTYQAAVRSAEGDLANAKANFDLQQVTVNRDKELLSKGLIAQSDYDTASAQLEEAAAQVQIKTASLTTARTNLSYCAIRSPIDGIVIKRAVDIGNSVAASLSSPTLFEIANDLKKMQIDAAVSEADIGNAAEGEEVAFTVDAYPNREFRGKVFQIRNAPNTQQNVVIYDVMISVDNSDLKLKPGMTANASIIVARRSQTLHVPNSALRFRMPDSIKFKPAAEPQAPQGSPAAPAKQLTSDERRAAMREIMQEAGYSFGGGPPSAEVRQKMIDLAKAKGIELPDRFLSGAGRSGGGGGDAPVFRTVYRLAGGDPKAMPEAVRVRLGISDGTNTEVFGDIKAGDVLITGLQQSADSRPSGQASPFGGGRGPGGFGR